MGAAQLEREGKLRNMASGEQEMVMEEMALRVQVSYRGYKGRAGAKEKKLRMASLLVEGKAALKIQAMIRGQPMHAACMLQL